MEGKVCSKCGVWKPLDGYHKKKNGKYGRQSKCRECQKEYNKKWRENNPDYNKQWKENNKEYKEYTKKYNKKWRENNTEYGKRWKENNKEYYKKYFKNNIERHHKNDKKSREKRKENNLQYISNLLEQINPIFKQLNLPVYGYVYMFENVKTGHKYVGQSILPITRRYTGGVVQGWVEERLERTNQKFKDELIEEDIQVTEVLDVAFCQYHLDKLEAYYIDKYDSFLNGYNNREGNHRSNDGIEEFNQILLENNLEFIDGKLVKIA
jgi:hypothetical protein